MAQVTMSDNSKSTGLRQRKNIRELQTEYDNGNKKPLSDLLRAFQALHTKEPFDDFNSWFTIAGYHGEPFRGAGWGNPQWWGGYCNHGNVLFPTWHRAYLWRLENALRSVDPSADVALPYWDETEDETLLNGIPGVFLQPTIKLDTGATIDNPLYSYKFQHQVWDNLGSPDTLGDYYKNKGYPTVRFPFCGLVGQDPQKQNDIGIYNQSITAMGPEKINAALNGRIQQWLLPSSDANTRNSIGIRAKFAKCLDAPNYTVFSNITSAQHYNQQIYDVSGSGEKPDGRKKSPLAEVPLEAPHNDMHLAVGGFQLGGTDYNNSVEFHQANGDMGENNTASFDPIFYFHHCFVDKIFWDWQLKHKATDKFDIIDGYPGTNSVDSQGPTPGVAGGTWLGMDSPLAPFHVKDDPKEPMMTSNDVINIETQLKYTYINTPPKGILLGDIKPEPVTHHAKIPPINRGRIGGSFIVQTYKEVDGKRTLLGYESVLSRWQTAGCANCQTHLNVSPVIPLHGVTDEDVKSKDVTIGAEIVARTNKDGQMLVGLNSVPEITPVIVKSA